MGKSSSRRRRQTSEEPSETPTSSRRRREASKETEKPTSSRRRREASQQTEKPTSSRRRREASKQTEEPPQRHQEAQDPSSFQPGWHGQEVLKNLRFSKRNNKLGKKKVRAQNERQWAEKAVRLAAKAAPVAAGERERDGGRRIFVRLFASDSDYVSME